MDRNAHIRQLRALALLFDYPAEAMQQHADELAGVLLPLQNDRACGAHTLPAFFAHLRDTELIELQAEYVDTFDRGASTSLNLFEHVHGDSRDRGQAMVDLLEQYHEVGLELATHQLPDYLPAYLEYCSMLEARSARAALDEVSHLLAVLAAALEHRDSPWLAPAAALCRLAGEADWRGAVERARAARDAGRDATPGPRDVAREGLPEDWTPEALDAAWAEQPVDFLGACNPQHADASGQAVRFYPRNAHTPSAGD